jgi:hypothetical protein
MRVRSFLLGLLIGLALALADRPALWRLLRDRLASGIDAVLRIGIAPAPPPPLSDERRLL